MAIQTQPVIDEVFPCNLSQVRDELEQRMAQLLPESGHERDLVALAMRESTLAPGKRLRPLLLILAARDLGYRGADLLDLACAVEMVHAASLVLDDMPCMDNARLRRGRPTIHLHFGEDVAILAAVALLSRAFSLVASAPAVAPLIRTQLVAVLANAVGTQGLVRGQYQDLREGTQARSAQDIATTNELKTGVLFGATLEMAAMVTGAEPCVRLSLREFALELGHAFQLYDDLQDRCAGGGAASGKDLGKDEGKSTLLALLGTEETLDRLRGHLRRADAHLSVVFGQDQAISALMRSIFTRAGLRA